MKVRTWTEQDPDNFDEDSVDEWTHPKHGYMKFTVPIFDEEGRLKAFDANEWDDDWIRVIKPRPPSTTALDLTDEWPFKLVI